MSNKPIIVDGDLVLSLASTVANSLDDNFRYYCDITTENMLDLCAKAHRKTLVHVFIETICCDGLNYIMRKHFDEEAITIMKSWLDTFNISYSEIAAPPQNCNYNELEEYADNLQSLFCDKALPKISEAVFCVLFNDKDFLYRFNCKITEQILELKKADYPEYLAGDGYLQRETAPAWLKKGVFHRDRGICQSCGRNLDNVFQNEENCNFDHIIPLRNGGSNDPSNYQLMCEHCNKSKRHTSSDYKNLIWPFWKQDD